MTTQLNMTVAEFGKIYALNRTAVYKMLAEGRGPKSVKIGRRRLISVASAAAWWQALESEVGK